MRTTVLHINHSVACLSPQVYGKALIMQHCLCSTHDHFVLPLSDPIFLWVMRRYEFSSNSFCAAKLFEFARDVFTTIIAPKSFHLLHRLFLNQGLELTELLVCLALLLHEEDLTLTRKFINKYHIILVLCCRSY